MTGRIRIGTRGSRLALAQTAIVASAVETILGPTETVRIHTSGDTVSIRRPHGTWAGPDGQFTREIERALLAGEIDVAVHSYKDLPTEPVDGLIVAAVLERGDARDCLVTADGSTLDELPFGARVGTSSPRRGAQLSAARADIIAVPMRGNVETRVARVRSGDFDGVLLAAAGLDRLGIPVPESARLSFDRMLPAPAQGALAVQVRADATQLPLAVATLDHGPTRVAVEAERALLRRVGGGCLAALGAYGGVSDGVLTLRAAFEDSDGSFIRVVDSRATSETDALVAEIAERLAPALAAP